MTRPALCTGRQLPLAAAGEVGVRHVIVRQVADPLRGALPVRVVEVELAAVAEVPGAHRHPGDPALGKAGGEVVAAAAVGDGDLERRAGARAGGGGAREGEVEDVAQAVPGQPGVLGDGTS